MGIRDYNASPALNTSIRGVNVAEGMERADVNNALRGMAADLAEFVTEFDLLGIVSITGVNDHIPLQAAVTASGSATPAGGVICPRGRSMALNSEIIVGDETVIDIGRVKTALSPGASGRAFSFGWTGTDTISNAGIRGGTLIDLYGVGATAVAVSNAANFSMSDTGIDLRDNNQIGIHLKATPYPAIPLGPYYGSIDNVRVTGKASPGSNQTGIKIEGYPAQGSLTPNRWNINSLRHIAAVDCGLDIMGVDGFTIGTVNLEGCYEQAIRFGFGNRTHTGAVTSASGAGGFTDTSLIGVGATLDYVGTFMITSGPNAGESARGYFDNATGLVTFLNAFPFQFTVGNTYVFTEPKARGCNVLSATYEGSSYGETCVEFLAGALGCNVSLDYVTMPTGNVFTRAVEDASNTVSRGDIVYTFEGAVQLTDGTEWLHINHFSSTAGGVGLPGTLWVDAVYATLEVKGVGTAGTILVEPYVNGASQPVIAKLTPDSPNYARRVRKVLPANALVNEGQHLKILLTKSGMPGVGVDQIRVEVHMGRL